MTIAILKICSTVQQPDLISHQNLPRKCSSLTESLLRMKAQSFLQRYTSCRHMLCMICYFSLTPGASFASSWLPGLEYYRLGLGGKKSEVKILSTNKICKSCFRFDCKSCVVMIFVQVFLDANNTSSNHLKRQFARSKKGTLRKHLRPIRKSLKWGKKPEILETIAVHKDRKMQKSFMLLFPLSPLCFPQMRWGEESISCGSHSINSLFLKLLTGQHMDNGEFSQRWKHSSPFFPLLTQ